ncbi:hypothetical protein [Chryseobacterium timonianum]|uniref:hypothetical protein n=1 Tax=Chryseobacterium timonianum TaxID=1805473 RepID=UPI001F4B8345|nr:hypothetical protein [Chryseobacterium timonianum]
MSTKEHNEHLEKLKSLSTKILKSRESASAFLVSAGIHTKNGNLTKHYITPSQPKQPVRHK